MLALTVAFVALCTGSVARAQENPDPTLQGVSRSQIQASGLKPNHTQSLRLLSFKGVGHDLPPLDGYDIVNDGSEGAVLLRGVRSLPGGPCDGLSDDAFFLIHAAGRPGDADGDGRTASLGSPCGVANAVISDGNGPTDPRLVSTGESVTLYISRKCSVGGDRLASSDLIFNLGSGDAVTPTALTVSVDNLTGHAGDNLGGEGTAWEASLFPATAAYNTSACPPLNDGYYIIRIPNWSRYFQGAGLNPGDFQWGVQIGSTFDSFEEDRIEGDVLLSQPKLSITKTPDLTLCPNEQGTYTIHVANDGNTAVTGVVVSDALPAGASIVSSSIPASGTTGTVTFQAFDLAQCESRDITVTVQASASCQGHDVNTANAAGSWASFCQFGNSDPQPVLAGPAIANFDCKTQPDISLSLDQQPARCEGDPINLTGRVTNNNQNDAVHVTLTVTPTPPGGQPAAFDIAAGGFHDFSIPVGNCNGNPNFTVDAVGQGACPPNDTDEKSVSVSCHPKPCVDNVTCDPSVASACPGTPITLAATARNCSATEEEDITLSYGNQSFTCNNVPAGQLCSHSFDAVMPECTSGQSVNFHIDASAKNSASPECGTATGGHDCTVACKIPTVEIVKTAESDVNFGDTIHYSIVVTNTSKDVALEDAVVVDNLCQYVINPANFNCTALGGAVCPGAPNVNGATITWPAFDLPAGASVTLTFEVLAQGDAPPGGQCTNDVSCTNHVTVDGHCADALAHSQFDKVTVIHCPPKGTCRITGGGCLNEDGGNKSHKQSTFGGNASPEHTGGGPTGNSWEHVYRDGKTILFNWHSPDAHVINCFDVQPGPCSPKGTVTHADFVGTGQYSIGAGGRSEDGNMVAYIEDHTEGACNKNVGDYYSIIVRTGLVIGAGDIVFQTQGTIDCGNLQIHQTPARLFGPATLQPGAQDASVTDAGLALLNKVVPNPFTSSMSFSFLVPEGGATAEIGVYNVAGRLIRSLSSGVQAAGRQTVTWDGKDNAGIRMANGVYFLRTMVGGQAATYRVIYMSR